MRVHFVCVKDALEEQFLRVDDGSLLLIGEEVGLVIDLVAELEGRSDILKRLAIYSKRKNLVIVVSTVAKIYRRVYRSVAVIDRGKIMGMSDMTHSVQDSIFNLGTSYRVYKTSLGAIGVVVGDDILFPEVMRTISLKETQYIVGLAGGIVDFDAKTLISTLSYLNGISTINIVKDRPIVANHKGEILLDETGKFLALDMSIERNLCLNNALNRGILDNIYIEE